MVTSKLFWRARKRSKRPFTASKHDRHAHLAVEALERRDLLSLSALLVSPGINVNELLSGARLGGITNNGSEALLITGASQAGGQVLPGPTYVNRSLVRNLNGSQNASSYDFIGPTRYYSDPNTPLLELPVGMNSAVMSPNGRYVAELFQRYEFGVVHITWPPDVEYTLRLGEVISFPDESIALENIHVRNGNYVFVGYTQDNFPVYTANIGYYGSDGSYYQIQDLPTAIIFTDFEYGALRVSDRFTNTAVTYTLDEVSFNWLNSVSDTGIVTGEGNLIAYSTTEVLVGGRPSYRILQRSPLQSIIFSASDYSYVFAPYGGSDAIVSADGSTLAFFSNDSLMVVPLSPNLSETINVEPRFSTAASYTPLSTYVGAIDLSADGRYVAFTTNVDYPELGDTNGLNDVYLVDTAAETPELVLASNSKQGNVGNGHSLQPAISDDGQFIAFTSFATNLSNSFVGPASTSNVFIKDTETGAVAFYTSLPLRHSKSPNISGDGSTVVFASGSFSGGTAYFDAFKLANPFYGQVAPVANHDTYTMLTNSTLSVSATHGLLANDSDANSDPLTVELLAGPVNGSLALNTNGSFTFTPVTDFEGTVNFSYRAYDGLRYSQPATVSINVSRPNSPPVTQYDVFYAYVDQTRVIPANRGVLVNDFDPDGDAMTVALTEPPLHGQMTLDADGGFTYTPNAGFVGEDYFYYRATDARGASSVNFAYVFVVTPSTPPIAMPQDAYTIGVGRPWYLPNINQLASDAESTLHELRWDIGNDGAIDFITSWEDTVITWSQLEQAGLTIGNAPYSIPISLTAVSYHTDIDGNSAFEVSQPAESILHVQPAPNVVYVHPDNQLGSSQAYGGFGEAIGYDAFSDIQMAIDAVAEGGTVSIAQHYGYYISPDRANPEAIPRISNNGKEVTIEVLDEPGTIYQVSINGGEVVLDEAATLRIRIRETFNPGDDLIAGFDYDVFYISSGLTLNGTRLELLGNRALLPTDVIKPIEVSPGYAFDGWLGFGLNGQFDGLASGSEVSFGDRSLLVNYDRPEPFFSPHSLVLTVANQAPSITTPTTPQIINQGSTAIIFGSWSDLEDTQAIDIVTRINGVIAGVVTVFGQDANGVGGWQWTLANVQEDAVVELTATDSGGRQAIASFELLVENVAPAVWFVSGPQSAQPGDLRTYEFEVHDPGDHDTFEISFISAGFAGTVSNVDFDNATRRGTFEVTFANDFQAGRIHVQVEDTYGAQSNVAQRDVSQTYWEVDSNFGNNSLREVASPADIATFVTHPDGSNYIASTSTSTPDVLVITAINADGTSKLEFGVNGRVELTANQLGLNRFTAQSLRQIQLRHHDRLAILVTDFEYLNESSSASTTKNRLLLLNLTGQLDSNFGANGIYALDFQNENSNSARFIDSMVVDGNGNFLLNGIKPHGFNAEGYWVYDWFVRKVLANGIADVAFGLNGEATIQTKNHLYNARSRIAVDQANRILLAGQIHIAGTHGDNFATSVVRLSATGIIDETFGMSGQSRVDALQSVERYTATSINVSDGTEIYLSGEFASQAGRRYFVAKFDSNGLKDDTFGNDGIFLDEFIPLTALSHASIDPHHRFFGLGMGYVGELYQPIIVAHDSDGSKLAGFGVDGIIATPSVPSTLRYFEDLHIQPDGSLLVLAIARENSSAPHTAVVLRVVEHPKESGLRFRGDDLESSDDDVTLVDLDSNRVIHNGVEHDLAEVTEFWIDGGAGDNRLLIRDLNYDSTYEVHPTDPTRATIRTSAGITIHLVNMSAVDFDGVPTVTVNLPANNEITIENGFNSLATFEGDVAGTLPAATLSGTTGGNAFTPINVYRAGNLIVDLSTSLGEDTVIVNYSVDPNAVQYLSVDTGTEMNDVIIVEALVQPAVPPVAPIAGIQPFFGGLGGGGFEILPGGGFAGGLGLAGLAILASNNVQVPAQGVVANENGITIQLGASFTVNGVVDGDLQNDGTLSGSGTVNGDYSGAGDIRPGNSPGRLTIDGDFVSTGRLFIEVDGNQPGISHDQLLVTGQANVTAMQLEVLSNYVLLPTDVLQVLVAGSLVGPLLGQQFPVDMHSVYTPNSLSLTNTPLATVDQVIVGNGTAQRSIVKQIEVSFLGLVDFTNLSATNLEDRPILVSRRGTAAGLVDYVAQTQQIDGRTIVTLVFQGNHVDLGGSLRDGNYDLVIKSDLVRVNGLGLDGDNDGVAGGDFYFGRNAEDNIVAADNFFRMFGDTDGDRDVDAFDTARFNAVFQLWRQGNWTPISYMFDIDGDSDLDMFDSTHFNARRRLRNLGLN